MKDDPATAYDLFAETVDQHADSLLLREECKNMITYQKAVAARDSGHYTEAYELFHKLDDYQDSSSQASAMMAKQQYQEAKKAADTGKYEDAVYLLENLTDKDSLDVEQLMTKPLFVSKDLNIDELLPIMAEHRFTLAVATDGKGHSVGVVSVEDILEELVGEIWDEDESPEVLK